MIKLNKIRVIVIVLSLSVLLIINIAHNSSKVSLGYFFGSDVESVNESIRDKYINILKENKINSITYFEPIWYWRCILVSLITVESENNTHNFYGLFFYEPSPIYINIQVLDNDIIVKRLGGYSDKGIYKDQELYSEFLIEQALLSHKLKNEIISVTRP